MEAEYIRSTRPATAKSAADGSRVGAAARSRPASGYTSSAYGGNNAYAASNAGAASRPHTAQTATTGASLSRPQTTKSLRSGSGESGLGASASDGELDAAAGGGARRDGASKLAQMQERTRHKAHVRHQVRNELCYVTLCNISVCGTAQRPLT